MSSRRDEQDYTLDELEKALSKDNASRVAIFRDREKDLSDPDYDRSYQKCPLFSFFTQLLSPLISSQLFPAMVGKA
ncbi:R3H domain-containing protein 2-like [Canna indica]|uniref:R3H domain-containing protein 2-like n=1 Tax=Canna indica TaxID=4628 RepID=A0AAQ3JYT4_9LILI|nr:R3H domain-containing protein 2-like [Canna indica]